MVETKTARKERLRAMRQKYGLGEYKTGGRARRTKTRGGSMARRKSGKRKGGSKGGFGGILSMKNIAGTLGGYYIAPMVGLDPKIGAAAGSYFIGKKGVMGAAVGYVGAPIVMGMLGGVKTGGSGTIFY
jgi:hypothetical protein